MLFYIYPTHTRKQSSSIFNVVFFRKFYLSTKIILIFNNFYEPCCCCCFFQESVQMVLCAWTRIHRVVRRLFNYSSRTYNSVDVPKISHFSESLLNTKHRNLSTLISEKKIETSEQFTLVKYWCETVQSGTIG